VLQSFLQNFPNKVNNIGRLASYGSWVNAYVCSIGGRIPVPQTSTGTPAYVGGVGIQPVAARCHS